ncbi:unnamed protein product, partial [Amoebophrya sp. A25]
LYPWSATLATRDMARFDECRARRDQNAKTSEMSCKETTRNCLHLRPYVILHADLLSPGD